MYKRDDPTLRLRAGYNSFTSEFVFELYDADGTLAIGLNSTGQVIVSGNIQTEQDIYAGKRLVVGVETSNIPYTDFISAPWYDMNTKGLFIAEEGTTEFLMAIIGTTGWLSPEMAIIYAKSDMNIEVPNRLEIYAYDDAITNYAQPDQLIKLQAYSHRIHIGTGDEMGVSGFSGYRKGVHIGDAFNNTFLSNGINLEDTYSSDRAMSVRYAEYDMQADIDYWWARNQKYIGHVSGTAAAASGNATVSASTNQISSTTPGRVVCNTTSNNSFIGAQETLASSLNLTTFTDGSAATTDDKLVALVFISDINALTLTNPVIAIQFGATSDINFIFRFNSTDLHGSGWNLLEAPLGGHAAVEGAPNLNNVSFLRFYWLCRANQTGKYGQLDYLAVVRKSPETDSNYQTYGSFNHFQNSFDGGVNWFNNVSFTVPRYMLRASANLATPWAYGYIDYDDSGSFGGRVLMSPNGNDPNLILAATNSLGVVDLGLKKMNYFIFEVKYEALVENNSPQLTWYRNDENYIICSVYNGELEIYGVMNNIGFYEWNAIAAYPRFYDCTITLIRSPSGEIRAQFKHDASITNYASVNYKKPAENQSGVYGVQDCYGFDGRLYIGSNDFGSNHRIKTVKIKPYNSDFWPKEYDK